MDKRRLKVLRKELGRQKPRELDRMMHDAHEEAFEQIECLDCANCCKTTGPLFTDKDIERIAKHLKISQMQFIDKYLRVDEDGDHVLQKVPCSFLLDNNECSIYEHRPKACREYPHTDRVKQHQILGLTFKNYSVCPAVERILLDMESRLVK